MNRFLKSLLVVCITWAIPGNAYFYVARIWKKTENRKDKFIVALGDFHADHRATRNQLYDLMERVPKDAVIINEDSYHLANKPNYQNGLLRSIFGYSWVHKSGDILANITSTARGLNIECINVECRRCLTELGENLLRFDLEKNDVFTCSQVETLIRKLIEDSKREIEVCKTFRADEQGFQKIYAQILEYAESLTRLLELLHGQFDQWLLFDDIAGMRIIEDISQSLCQDIGSQGEDETIKILKDMSLKQPILASLPILDMHILQQLYKNRDRSVIFLTAGAMHIFNIDEAIKTLGYSQVPGKSIGEFSHADDAIRNPISMKNFLEPLFPLVRRIKQPTLLGRNKGKIVASVVIASLGLLGYGIYKLHKWHPTSQI